MIISSGNRAGRNRDSVPKMSSNSDESIAISKRMICSDRGWEEGGWKFSDEELANSPSLRDMPACAEKLTKRNIHEFLFKCGKQLRTKTLVMAAAATMCQRFYAQKSLIDRHRYHVASAALLLASKVEEFPVPIEHVLKVTHDVWFSDKSRTRPASFGTRELFETNRVELIEAEKHLMCAIQFDFNIEHPYPHVHYVIERLGMKGWLSVEGQLSATKGAIQFLNQSLRGTMCLVYPPSYRARLVVYVALLCNEIAAPAGARGSWIIALRLGDKQRLKEACCDLVDCLDEDAGKSGIKLTWALVLRVLISEGMVRNMDGSNPGPTPTPPSRPKPPLNPKPSSKPSPPSSPRPLAHPRPPSNPRPPSTPKPVSNSKPHSNPRPPSTPKPPSYPRAPSIPRPPSTPKPPSYPRAPSIPRPPSTPKPPSYPRPPSNARPPRPRPQSTPMPPSNPRRPSNPKRHPNQVDSEMCRKMARTASSPPAPVAQTAVMRPAVSPKSKRLLDTDDLEMGQKENTRTSKSVPAAARHGVGDDDVEDGEVSI